MGRALLDSKRRHGHPKSDRRLLLSVYPVEERSAIKTLRDRIVGRVPWFSLVRTWVLIGGALALLAFGPTWLTGALGRTVRTTACFGVVIVPIPAVIVLASWASKRRTTSLWRALLWYGRCAVCARALDRELDEEGFVRCRRCGAWWAMSRLRWGRCPGCGYSLGGVPRNDDGEVVCPECGEGWNVPDVSA